MENKDMPFKDMCKIHLSKGITHRYKQLICRKLDIYTLFY